MTSKTILHYRLLKEIGKGGMGVVYKAEDTKLHRTVAVKALSADLIGDEKARARFLREARACSAIDHPNICAIYEVNEAEGMLFFVMQYIDGKTLKKEIGGRPMPIERALDLSLQLAEALDEAHKRNVIHRDIKSSNIMVNERGQAKILDFGLAKLVAKADSEEGEELIRRPELTKAGTPFGTASYMSPEQASGERADRRSDLFSLGIVMYEMFTGRLPFKGRTSVDVMHEVMHSEPEPTGDSVPPGIQRILMKALTKDRGKRYQTAEQVLSELRAFIRDYYSAQKSLPPEQLALLRASTYPQRKAGLMSRVSSWLQSKFSGRTAIDDGSRSGEFSSSMWRTSDKKAIAILPFKNLSGSVDAEFYSFSLADSVITELAQLHDLVVRPSSFIIQYQNKDVDPREVGAKLAVDAVLAGGYLKSGERFRVTPQLIDARSGEIIWSDKIDVSANDIITVQDTIARHIVDGLRVRTTSSELAHLVTLTDNAPAYEAYLRGRDLLHRFIFRTLQPGDLEGAVSQFKTAVELDPQFALAHSGLGVCYVSYVLKGMGGIDYYRFAKESLERALAIDPELIEARVRMVYVDLAEGAAKSARREVHRLLRQAHNEPDVHVAAAYVYRLSGIYDRALDEWDAYLKLSPEDVVLASYNRARIQLYRKDTQSAAKELEAGLAVAPDHPLLRLYSAMIHYVDNDFDTAITELNDILEKYPDLYSYRLFLSMCYASRGEGERALGLIDEKVIASARADQDSAYWLGSIYAATGKPDEAIEWLKSAVSMGNENYPWLEIDPMWEPMRSDARYQEVMDDLRLKWEKLAGGGSGSDSD